MIRRGVLRIPPLSTPETTSGGSIAPPTFGPARPIGWGGRAGDKDPGQPKSVAGRRGAPTGHPFVHGGTDAHMCFILWGSVWFFRAGGAANQPAWDLGTKALLNFLVRVRGMKADYFGGGTAQLIGKALPGTSEWVLTAR